MSESVTTAALKATGLVKKYKGAQTCAVDHIDLSIAQGEIFGLLGPNGAGKTTAISMFSTLLAPGGGRVEIFGNDIIKYARKVQKMLGLVPQEIALYPEMSGRENMMFFGRLYGLKGGRLNARVSECLEFVGLSEKAEQMVYTYSGGMKRRINLAVGILHEPKLLFLDEPTVGIDAQSRNMILEKLSELKQSGVTMLYTTHYMEEAELLCSRVAIIDQGRIIAQGEPAAMVRDGNFSGLQDLFFQLTGRNLRD